ncbi:MAG: hypothetical protein SPK28_04085 [Bacilli bacterium]|nr:hypothetical protein [Bacilli bacterium]
MTIEIVDKGTCEKFKKNLLVNSNSKDYDTAKNEWEFVCSYKDKFGSNCICGHPIHNIFEIANIHNFKKLKVGEDCIKYFHFDKICEELAKEQDKCSKLNKLYKFICNLYNRGMIYRFNDIELLNFLSRDDYHTLSKYFYYDKEQLQGLSVKEIDEFMHRDYLTSIVKRLCDIYHEQEKLVKCKTYLVTEFKLTNAQKEKFITCRNKNIKRILKK